MPGRGRPVLVGVLLGLILVVAVFGYVAYAYTAQSGQVETDRVLLIGLTEDADGAQVAGIVGVLDWTPGAERIRVIDPLTEIAGTGTSYTALKDQYPFGGGASVSEAVASIEGGEPLPWIVLPADVWIGLVDAAGGLNYDVERSTNAYVRGELFLIEAGEQTLSGGETYAIAAAGVLARGDRHCGSGCGTALKWAS